MLIGIMSDSHGDCVTTGKALQLFDSRGAAHLIHCGDICSTSVLDQLVGRPCTFVWGNCDRPDDALTNYLRSVDLGPPTAIPTTVTLHGKRFAVFHGHETRFETDLHSLSVDYICHGHTHVPRDDRLDGKRIINPGALHRANPKTVAMLDLNTDELTFYEIK